MNDQIKTCYNDNVFIYSKFIPLGASSRPYNSIMEAGQVQWRVVKLVIDLEQHECQQR